MPNHHTPHTLNTLQVCAECDYLTVHVPYMDATHHLVGPVELANLKPDTAILNFARGELIDAAALWAKYDDGSFRGRYIADFPLEELHDCPQVACNSVQSALNEAPQVTMVPHLGASTEEAEALSATMAATEVRTAPCTKGSTTGSTTGSTKGSTECSESVCNEVCVNGFVACRRIIAQSTRQGAPTDAACVPDPGLPRARNYRKFRQFSQVEYFGTLLRGQS